MSTKQDGGPAFPAEHGLSKSGMSLRDWFAGQAMAGLCLNGAQPDYCIPDNIVASIAYRFADAMLAERSKP